MGDFKWYRSLRGGMWVCVFLKWYKAPKSKYKSALSLQKAGYNVEDHRYKFEK